MNVAPYILVTAATIFSVALPLSISAAPVGTPDPSHGQQVFARCSACHASTANTASGFGPTLWGVVGRKAGGPPGFAYSPALKGAGFPWTTAKLDAFIAKPSAVVPGNRMPFPSVSDANDRRDLVAYLSTLKDRAH